MMTDKTEIEQVCEALDLMHSDHPFDVFSDEEIATWARLVEPYMGDIEKALQEKLERLENSLPPAPKQGDK